MKKFPVAIQLYSVREEAQKDLKGTLQALKEMGYDGVEFAGLYGHSPKEVKEMLEEIGLEAVSAHVPIEELLEDVSKAVADYKMLGCQYIAVPWLEEKRRPGNAQFEQTLTDVKTIGRAAKETGMQLLYHNHDFEFTKIGDKYALDVLYDTVPAELLQTQLDTCWVNVGGEDPVKYVLKYAGRAPLVHLKDFVGSKTDNMYELIGTDVKSEKSEVFGLRPVGNGIQDFPAIIDACEKAGTDWLIVEQDFPDAGHTPMECAAISRAYLKTIGQ